MTGFLAELRRRGVAKAAAVYAVVAWALIEASSVIFPALGLPDWTVTFVVLLALFGFPIVLIVAWVFDWTRGGIVRTPAGEGATATPARARVLDFVVIAVLLAVIGWLGWERAFDAPDGAARGALDSIAVLPFVNMSGDPDNEYFGDGLAEELLNSLVRIDGLRVAARTSSFEYKGRNIDVRRIGEALNVSSVLEGSVRKSGDRIRVTAQLIRSDDGFHLWSDTYDASLEDVFAVQDRIALAIVDALRVRLQSHERARVVAHNTRDVQAFEAYLRGRYELNRRTASSLDRAVEEFRAAIARDPQYAAAYSGLSDAWMLRSNYGNVSVDEALRQAEPLARRALELDPELAEAHASLGLVLRNKDTVADSIAPLRRAIELNPSYSAAYHWLGLTYSQLGRFNEAAEVMRRSVEVDPHYVTGKRALLNVLRAIGEDDEADALAARIARDHADDPMALYGVGGDAVQTGRRVDALRHYARALRLAPDNLSLRASTAYLLLGLGDFARADEQVRIIGEVSPGHPVVDGWAADRAVFAGDTASVRDGIARQMRTLTGLRREQFACNSLLLVEDFSGAVAACRAGLERSGWQPGDTLPAGMIDLAANLLLAAKGAGQRELSDQVLVALRAEFDRVEREGLAADELRWARALIDAHAGDDVDPLIEILPQRLRRGNWNWRQLRDNLLFAPIRDDPRFIAIVDGLRERVERERAEADRIEIPGL